MEDENVKPEEIKLYRYHSTRQNKETYEVIEDSDWLYLDIEEYDKLVFNYINTGVYDMPGFMDDEEYPLVGEELRAATKEEEDAFTYGLNEGGFIAKAKQVMDEWNGSAFRVDTSGLDEDGKLKGIKVFICGLCDKHDEFTEAATLGSNMYLSVLKEDSHVLWHICKGCANG